VQFEGPSTALTAILVLSDRYQAVPLCGLGRHSSVVKVTMNWCLMKLPSWHCLRPLPLGANEQALT